MSELEKQIAAAEQEWMEGWQKGPKRVRWTKVPLQVGDTAPDFELLDPDGKPMLLSSFWYQRPALLLFWRHYCCSCGRERAARLQNEYANYIELGANVVLIGPGAPLHMRKKTGSNILYCAI